jgi:sigma-E factor negative regulatory protein RseA
MTDELERPITGPIHDQISAFVDDELSDEEASFLVRRLERDADARKQLLRYTTIGSALRGELLQPDPGILRRRIESAFTGSIAAPATRSRLGLAGRRQLMRPLVSVGIAAAVAIAAVLLLRAMNESRLEPGASGQIPIQARQLIEPQSYVVPPDGGQNDIIQNRSVVPPIRLTNYLVHHGEYASRLSRTSVHSNVVSASDSPRRSEDQAIRE